MCSQRSTVENHTTRITGPMSLVKRSGWYITDYRRNGVDVADSISPVHAKTETVDVISVRLLGIDLDGRGEEIWFKATNGRSWDVAIVSFDAKSGSTPLEPFMWRPMINDLLANHWFVTQI